MFDRNLIVGLVVLAVIALGIYASGILKRFTSRERFTPGPTGPTGPIKVPGANPSVGGSAMSTTGATAKAGSHVASGSGVAPAAMAAPKSGEGFADFIGADMGTVPMGDAARPQACYPREQLNPSELLPMDTNAAWAASNPAGSGDIAGKNFLSAGALAGINSIGQSMRNPNLQLRSEPPCPQVRVSPWQQSTIEPDLARRPLE